MMNTSDRLAEGVNNFITAYQELWCKIGEKHPNLKNKMDWDVVFAVKKGLIRGSNFPEESICNIFEFLEGYSKWRNELGELYGYQIGESIELRMKLLNEALTCLSGDDELLKLAYKELEPRIMKDLSYVYLEEKEFQESQEY